MAELRTDEEQVEAIKQWWKNNGSSLLIGIGAALAIVFGWQAWQNQQAQQRTEAASQFVTLMNAFGTEDETSADTVAFVAKTLRDEHADSAYAVYANLMLARVQLMQNSDAEGAVESLQWALNKAAETQPLALVVRSRLAQAQMALDDYDAALATIDGAKDSDAFGAMFAELRGDILLAKGDQEGAREAYLAAREQGEENRSGVLQLKLADLGVGGDA
ncbi:tetratricopeptide repeat protein [Marinobacter sp. M3C]|jgi:predicted negative regulator of RcsB-dependent stress response|uniref:YfgM family protein n=1 Tax=unclassified Marinobacter TaxID=83889 RepID=UPI00200BF997|nr:MULTISPECIES: tetratricopeptide repeat protein [unclassified Marinobacter]MCL1478677.1 tetratricopeptide repeat protein [Marinobacter sp.]MCL1481974.1 tetratricopeptide repeat protein [Marinobacter sp.]MCL1484312.1 tetratricopeptide repeat protein [Marinobacter sp.]MCL1488165.1 tetratricopeptide repeat protein [Marinobacter sp.]UQG57839.1 tetratricopeptide repeat protein [Marinobacter sp. M4C]